MNDLDLWYSWRFIYSFSWMNLPTLISYTTTVSEKSIILQKQKGPNWHYRKIGQGQSRVIIWTNLVVLEYPMLHTNFQGHRLFGSREEDYLTRYGRGYVTWTIWTNFPFPHPMKAPHEIWLQSAYRFLRKRSLKMWIWVTLDQGQSVILTFDIHIGSRTHLVNCIYQLWHHRLQ